MDATLDTLANNVCGTRDVGIAKTQVIFSLFSLLKGGENLMK
jgi:hypothetical protein